MYDDQVEKITWQGEGTCNYGSGGQTHMIIVMVFVFQQRQKDKNM